MNIRSVGWALSWRYWRRGIAWFVPASALLPVACMAPAYAVLCRSADVHAELNYVIFGVVCWIPLVIALVSRGFLRQHYALPLRTSTLVGWTLANGAMIVALSYGLTALSFNALYHVGWPLWGPAWWAVVVYAAFQAVAWSVAGARGSRLVSLVLLMLLMSLAEPSGLYRRVVPAVSDDGAESVWPAISAAEWAVSLILVAGCCLAAVYVVGRDRRGDAWALEWLSLGWWWQRFTGRISATAARGEFVPRSFRSASAAQFWMEWRSKGRYVPAAVAATVLLLWSIAACHRLDRSSVADAAGGLTAMLVMASPLVGLYLGHRSERFDIQPFLATRPLGDGEAAMVVLRHAAAACGAGAAIWLIGVAAAAMACGWNPVDPEAMWAQAGALGGYLLFVWTLVGLGVALAMSRSWFVLAGGLGACLLLIGFVAAIGMSGRSHEVVLQVTAGGFFAGTWLAFAAAWRKDLLCLPAILGAVIGYVFLVAWLMFAARASITSAAEMGMLLGVAAPPLAPLAAAPLALAWNRHR